MSITRTVFAMSACLWLTTGTAGAEFIGLNIGTPGAQPAQPTSSSRIDLVDDLDLDNPAQTSMVLILEHPIAVLPNIRYQGYSLDSSDIYSINPELSTNQGSAGASSETASSFDLAHDDIVLYYQLLNNWIDLDMGVDLKRFDGQVSHSGVGSSIDIDETIPLLHLSARVSLPINGLYVGADINANFIDVGIDVGISESYAQDSTIMLGYETGSGLGIAGGIKSFSLELDDSNEVDTDLEYDGLFLNGYFNF